MKSIFPHPIYLGAATRSPIGKFGGALKRFSAPELAALTLKEALKRSTHQEAPDYVILGHARQAGCGPNPARQALIKAGLSNEIPALTINQACASGMASIVGAAEKISLGKARSIWAGGVESMSNTPYLLPQVRWGHRMGHAEVVDGMHKDGFFCPLAEMLMGGTVEEFIVKEQKISRQDQDDYAFQSQVKANRAWSEGLYKDEIFEIFAEGKNPGLATDEHRRIDIERGSLDKLSPVFDAKNGSVTAGNSSGITDGAAFVEVSNRLAAHSQVELIDFECTALDPKKMGMGPVPSIKKILARQSLSVNDIQIFEINEAFAGQVLACQRALQIPSNKLNPRGSSIAIGHPIGCTGTRITVSAIHQIKKLDGALAIASLCVSGGMGLSILIRGLK